MFSEQGTSASHMAAAKLIDALSRCNGMDGQDADAVGAYTQVTLQDMADEMGEELVDTWISLPKHKQPASWAGIENPVCLLARNLYGHPRAGLYWEKFCEKHLFAVGFEAAAGFECMYVHKELGLFLSVYVDDFKMAGRAASLLKMWKILGTRMELDPPTPMIGNTYLGCGQIDATPEPRMVAARSTLFHAANTSAKLGPEEQHKVKADAGATKPRGYAYDMKGHVKQSIDRYLELSGTPRASLTKVCTPCIDDHMLQDSDFITEGVLALEAARIVLKSLYVARMGRPDLLWSVNSWRDA